MASGGNSCLSEWLAFDTTRTIRVRVPLLGIIYYLTTVAILIYIIVYVFIMQKHYLLIETPQGFQRVNVEDPCIPLNAETACTYPHLAGTPGLDRTCYLPSAFRCPHHAYCATSDTPKKDVNSEEGGKMPCKYWDHNSMVFPPSEKGALTLATRAIIVNQELTNTSTINVKGVKKQFCQDQAEMECQWYPLSREHAYTGGGYMADVGNFTVNLQHSFWAPTLPIEANSEQMSGAMMKCKAGMDCDDNPDHWEVVRTLPKGNKDSSKMTLRDILYVVTPGTTSHVAKGVAGPGMDLDDMSDACPEKCGGKLSTYRFMGMMLHIELTYDNTGLVIPGSSEDDIKYTVKVFAKPKTIYDIEVVQRASDANKRTIHHLFGVRMVFDAGGQVGQFQFTTAMLQLSTSFALFAFATILVDKTMLWILPCLGFNKDASGRNLDYEQAKYATWPPSAEEVAQLEKLEKAYQTQQGGTVGGPEKPPGMQSETQPLLSGAGTGTGSGSGSGIGGYGLSPEYMSDYDEAYASALRRERDAYAASRSHPKQPPFRFAQPRSEV